MNPIGAGATPNSRDAYRQQYLNLLQLDISNQTKNLNANKLFKANGSTGAEPADTRSITEKYADLDGLKREVRSGLKQITDGQEAEHIVAELTTNEIEFLAGQLPAVITDLKPKWKFGIPASSFIPYIRKLMRKNIETEGVEYGLQQPSATGGGGVVATANNLVPRQTLDEVGRDLDDIMTMGKLSIKRSARAKLQRISAGIKKMIELKPEPEDRIIVKHQNDIDMLWDYDQLVNEISESLPSANFLIERMKLTITKLEQGHLEDLEEMIWDMEEMLDAVEWGKMEELKSIINQIRVEQRRAGESPDVVRDFSEVASTAPSTALSSSAYELEPLGTKLDKTEIRQSENAGTDLPSSYVEGTDENDYFPIKPVDYTLPLEVFQSMSADEKKDALITYDNFGDFDAPEMREIKMFAQVLQRGQAPPENELDYAYAHYLNLLEGRPSIQNVEQPRVPPPLSQAFSPQTTEQPRVPPPLSQGVEEEEPGVSYSPLKSIASLEPYAITYEAFQEKPKRDKFKLLKHYLAEGDFDRYPVIKHLAVVLDKYDPEKDMDELYAYFLEGVQGESPIKASPPKKDKSSWSDISTELGSYKPPSVSDLGGKTPPRYPMGDLSTELEDVPSQQIKSKPEKLVYVSFPKFKVLPKKDKIILVDRANELFDDELIRDEDYKFFKDHTSNLPKEDEPVLDKLYQIVLPVIADKGILGEGIKAKGRPKKTKNIIFGMGLNVVPQPKARVSVRNIDLSKGIEAEPAYVPFGTHLLNKHRLSDNIVMLRTKKGGAITNIPTQKISTKLANVLKVISGGGVPHFESVMDLEAQDKSLLHQIAKTSKVSDRLSVPNPDRSKLEQESQRFDVLRGEISIGQDNPAVIKEFKVLLLKMMREGRVPMGQGKAIMEELLLLGH